jgi:hypothetical protein
VAAPAGLDQPSEEEQEEAWRLYGKQAEAIWYLAPMGIWRALKSLHPEVQSHKLPGRPQIEKRIKRLREGKNTGLNNELLGLIENKQLTSVDVIRFYSSKGRYFEIERPSLASEPALGEGTCDYHHHSRSSIYHHHHSRSSFYHHHHSRSSFYHHHHTLAHPSTTITTLHPCTY